MRIVYAYGNYGKLFRHHDFRGDEAIIGGARILEASQRGAVVAITTAQRSQQRSEEVDASGPATQKQHRGQGVVCKQATP
ncbi:hypothetical protein SKAU_G00081940 [Synaphobranchus kaupii]|uniref:Uncharacterized protein n=1 Tax=Synaphobranchus kaupii TaxID=118154 RepID=A0A9Q1FVW3_SYNKA|nr:hypothetical protein SKAU_G00081940 [Synaphobranchus kaupii]